MRSKVAEELRSEQMELLRRMTPSERVVLAFELGERDLQFYMAMQNVDRQTAIEAIRREHQNGRRHSLCMTESLK
ncbi:MAG: hypothetical protein DMF58_14105 [Acidobacteria bacterium]|nr:MAG: hypothetical protein DMF58_14105 [Acidobacteriota bacterium]